MDILDADASTAEVPVGDRSDAGEPPARATVEGTAAEEDGKDEIQIAETSDVEQALGGRTPVLLDSWHRNSQDWPEFP